METNAKVTHEIWMVVVGADGIVGVTSRRAVKPDETVYDGPMSLAEAGEVVNWLDECEKEVSE